MNHETGCQEEIFLFLKHEGFYSFIITKVYDQTIIDMNTL